METRKMLKSGWARAVLVAAVVSAMPMIAHAQEIPHRNVILFVADGLRHGAVDTGEMPTFAAVRRDGVDFVNSHSLFPTVTTPNASAIATGHYLGDTGDFGNKLFLGILPQGDGVWGAVHDVESNTVMRETNTHFDGNFLNEDSLLAVARTKGFNTAVIGKAGPVLFQDITRVNAEITPDNVGTVVIDDATGRLDAKKGRQTAPLRRDIIDRISNDPYFLETYFNGEKPEVEPPSAPRGANGNTGMKVANVRQQKYFIDTVTRAILPVFADPKGSKKPFVLIYWSRDPDGSQHNAGDSEGKLVPGINSETVTKAFHNADDNLKQLLDYLKATPDPASLGKMLSETTDVFLTSDHGFGTVSKKQLDLADTKWDTFATRQRYADTPAGNMPEGIFAIDLAHDLGMPLYDADTLDAAASTPAKRVYKKLRMESTDKDKAEHADDSHSLIGGGTVTKDGTDASILVVPTGGAELIYFPPRIGLPDDRARSIDLLKKIVASAAAKPYISGAWVDTDRFGPIDGTLALADIALVGTARTPRPAMVLGLRSFSTDPARPEMTGVQVGDSGYKQGYGNHGTFGRHDTFNCMMAIGPDFKKAFSDTDPVSNADIAVTLGKIVGIDMPALGRGQLHGRVISEAIAGGPAPKGSERKRKESTPAPSGEITTLLYQIYKDEAGHDYFYFDVGGYPGRAVGLPK